jgi:uncharacterized protein YPO0396
MNEIKKIKLDDIIDKLRILSLLTKDDLNEFSEDLNWYINRFSSIKELTTIDIESLINFRDSVGKMSNWINFTKEQGDLWDEIWQLLTDIINSKDTLE